MNRKLNLLLSRLKKERYLNQKASSYYDKLQFRFTIPSILITALSGIASFLGTSTLVSNDTQNILNISVGVFTSLSSLMQSISASCGYDSKKEDFKKAANEYNNLINKVKFEIDNPNENLDDFFNNIESEIEDIQKKCGKLPPLWIYQEWTKEKHNFINNDGNYKDDNYNDNNYKDNNYKDNNYNNLSDRNVNDNVNIQFQSNENDQLLLN